MEPSSLDDPLGPSIHSSISASDRDAVERLKALLADAELRHRIEDTARGGDVGALADLVAELVYTGARVGSERNDPIQEQP